MKQFFVILGHFLPYYPPLALSNPENQSFKKMRKKFGDVTILNLCSKKHDLMIYTYSDMKCNRQNLFVILGHFLPFYHPNIPKSEYFTKMKKKAWRYHHLTHVYQKSRSYAFLFLIYGT